jgi:hypothetical protein
MQKLLHSILLLSTLVSSNFISGMDTARSGRETEETSAENTTDKAALITALKAHRKERLKGTWWLLGGFLGVGLTITSLDCTYETSTQNHPNGAVPRLFAALTGLSAIGSGFAFWKSSKIYKKAVEKNDDFIFKNQASVKEVYTAALDKCNGNNECEGALMVKECLDSFLRFKKSGNNAFDAEIKAHAKKTQPCNCLVD